jgi:glycolate oxidase FAD binding subunit
MAQIAAQNLKDVREALRWARDEDKQLELYSGGTKRAIGRPATDSYGVSVKPLSGILFYEPAELVISMRAATPLAEVNALLAEHKQVLAFEPPDWSNLFSLQGGSPTCCGVIGSNSSGSRRILAGAARDHLLGFRAISGRGVDFQSGGRVVKNVTGYDLSKLMTGSWGTLAIMYELTLKTMPAAETTRTLFLYGAEDDEALRWMNKILSQNFAISGAAHIPLATAKQWGGLDGTPTSLTAFRLEGTQQATQSKLNELQILIGTEQQINNNEGEAALQFWHSVNNLSVFSAPSANTSAPLWRILTPRNQAAHLAARLSAECEDVLYFMEWGGGLIWLSHDVSSGETELGDFIQKANQIRNICLECDAQAILIRASKEARERISFLPPLSSPLAALTARIKNAFDPNGILNPGRLYYGI